MESLARWIIENKIEEFCEEDLVDYLDAEPEGIRRVIQAGIETGDFVQERRLLCCGLLHPVTASYCDECEIRFSPETEKVEVIVVMNQPEEEVAEFPLKIVEDDQAPSIAPFWYKPKLDDFLVPSNNYHSHDIQRGLKLLSESGLYVFRLSGSVPTDQVLHAVIHEIGTPTEWQNKSRGPIKEIKPTDTDARGTGDSKSDLGFHVDGTQHTRTPQFLIFQYISLQKMNHPGFFRDSIA